LAVSRYLGVVVRIRTKSDFFERRGREGYAKGAKEDKEKIQKREIYFNKFKNEIFQTYF
jgi:hypothetical protein